MRKGLRALGDAASALYFTWADSPEQATAYRYRGGGEAWAPPLDPPTHPHQKIFLRKKMKFIKGARNWRSSLGTQTFCWPLTPPPPGIGHGRH